MVSIQTLKDNDSRFEHPPVIARQIRLILKSLEDDPDNSLNKSRKVCERVMKDVYLREMGEPTKAKGLFELMRNNQFTRKLPSYLPLTVESIRTKGNYGSHDAAFETELYRLTREACLALYELQYLLEWYYQSFENTGRLIEPTVPAKDRVEEPAPTKLKKVAIPNEQNKTSVAKLSDEIHSIKVALGRLDHKKAKRILKPLLKIHPRHTELRRLEVISLLYAQNHDLALEKAAILGKENPKDPIVPTSKIWSYLYSENKDYGKAFECIHEHIEAAPEEVYGWFHSISGAYFEIQGAYPAAGLYYKKALEDFPDRPYLMRSIARCDRKEGQNEDALATIEQAIRLHEDADFYQEKAFICELLGELEAEKEAYEKAIELDPTETLYPYNKGAMFLRLKQYIQARSIWKKIPKNSAYYEDAITGILASYEKQGGFSFIALKLAKEFNAEFPQNTTGREYLAYFYRLTDQIDKSVDTYNKLIEEHGGNYPRFINRAICFRLLNQPTEALDDLKSAEKERPNQFLVQSEMARNYYVLKRYDEALTIYNKIERLRKLDSICLYFRAKIYWLRGQKGRSFNDMDKAISIGIKDCKDHHFIRGESVCQILTNWQKYDPEKLSKPVQLLHELKPLSFEKAEAVKRQDYKTAAKIRDKQKDLRTSLIAILEESITDLEKSKELFFQIKPSTLAIEKLKGHLEHVKEL